MRMRPIQNSIRHSPPLMTATIVFLVAAIAAGALMWRLEQYRIEQDRARLLNVAGDHAAALQRHLERAFSATYALAALVRQGNGSIRDFRAVAGQMLPLYPGVAALELVPGGVVQAVVPLAGNEQAIGHDLLQDPLRNREAFLARGTGKLTLAGPFNLVQGGLGAVARLPVFLENAAGGKKFWGFTAVLIRFPESLVPARLPKLAEQGLGYELWRIHPDTKQKQVIAASSSATLNEPVQKSLELPNGIWILSVAPISGWSNPAGLSLKVGIGLLFSLLLGWLAKLLIESKAHEEGLETVIAERTAEIHESEERLRLLADNLPDSYIYQYAHEDDNPRFLQVSAGVERLHAVSRQDVLRDADLLRQQLAPGQLSDLSAAEVASRSEMADFYMVVRVMRPDGQHRWLQLRSRPRRRPGGSVVWDGVATDITERKGMEDALRNERDFSDAVLNSLPSVFYLFDEHLRFMRWNDKLEQVTGYTRDEIARSSPLDFFAGGNRDVVAEGIRKVFERGSAEVEVGFVGRDGAYTAYYLTGARTRVEGVNCLLGVGIDITARKQAETSLEEARTMAVQKSTFLEAVMEALPVGVAIIDARGEIINVNTMFKEAWAGTYPVTNASAAYKAWWIETGLPVEPEELASARAVLKDEKVTGQLLKVEKPGGIQAYLHNNAAPFHDTSGRVAGCAVAVMDITEQIETKQSLVLAKEAAEAANSAKSQFLANMSHELRTPMTGILGLLQIALEDDLSPTTRQYLEKTLNSARSLLRILNDILDMTSIGAGRLSTEEKPFLLRECVAEAADVFTIEAQSKGLVIDLSVADDVPSRVAGDKLRLRQVLLNLIGNAIKFTAAGKVAVHVTAGSTTVEGKREISFSVIDTGIGIPERKKEMIFNPFSQVDPSYSRSFGGSGLGLAISKEIVTLLGGEISFESTEGAGSTFSFTIPLAEAPQEEDEPVAPGLGSTGPALSTHDEREAAHILVAEDDPTIRDLLSRLLKRSNLAVDVAGDGQEAVEKWATHPYDLILMDVQMPRLNGFEATRAIREKERERGGHIPIVAVTAHASKEDEERCRAAGMDAYIRKPIDFARCLEVIAETIRQRKT